MNEDSPFSSLLSHLDELRKRLINSLIPFSIFTIFFLMFRFDVYYLYRIPIPYPYPDVYRNVGAQFLLLLEQHLLPAGMKIIVIKPADSLIADLYSTMFLALIFSMPVIVNQFSKFVGPALKKSERRAIGNIGIPAAILFASGAFVGLWLVAPALFYIFYEFDLGLGAVSYLSLVSFTNFVLIYITAFGLSFELPVIMVGLTRAELVSSEFWRKNWRYAVVGALIFGMIFSPGAFGFTMVMMALPIIALYFGGIYFAERYEKKARAAEELEGVSESL